jgi:hypothetical protein
MTINHTLTLISMYYDLASAQRDLMVVALANFHWRKRKNESTVHYYNLCTQKEKQKGSSVPSRSQGLSRKFL